MQSTARRISLVTNQEKGHVATSVPLKGVRNKNYASIHHVPLIEWQLVEIIWDETVFGDTKRLEHRLLPEATTALDSRNSVNNAKRQDAFDRSGDNTKGQRLRIVLVPGLYVECKCR